MAIINKGLTEQDLGYYYTSDIDNILCLYKTANLKGIDIKLRSRLILNKFKTDSFEFKQNFFQHILDLLSEANKYTETDMFRYINYIIIYYGGIDTTNLSVEIAVKPHTAANYFYIIYDNGNKEYYLYDGTIKISEINHNSFFKKIAKCYEKEYSR